MFYQKLTFPKIKDRPFFYTNFVQTLDGKVAIKREGYWPIGSSKDHEVLEELRLYADCLIHGGNLGRQFGEQTVKNISTTLFKQKRRVLGKSAKLPYYIITSKLKSIKKSPGANVFHLKRGLIAQGGGIASHLIPYLREKGYKNVLVEGGPTLLGSFLKVNLIDEIFLTIAPKIYGTEPGKTLNLIEGVFFSPLKIKTLKLVSIKKIGNEVFLRYSLN